MAPTEEGKVEGTPKTKKPQKGQMEWAKKTLHPRWIAVQHGIPSSDSLHELQKSIQTSLESSKGSRQQPIDFRSLVGDVFVDFDRAQRELMLTRLQFLTRAKASEVQWEADLWRPWFLKNTVRTPDSELIDNRPFIGRTVQAKMFLLSESESHDGPVLPPALASPPDRKESVVSVDLDRWMPDSKRKESLWYPDYLYAVSWSSLAKFVGNESSYNHFPAFRLAQHKYLPASWVAEIKAKSRDEDHLGAENYLAIISAYLLHERLLLRWITKNKSRRSRNPVAIDESLSVYCLSCCGEVCRIYRMSIRPMSTNSNIEPVRYDMQQLHELRLTDDNGRGATVLGNWINTLNALALTVHLKSITADVKTIMANGSNDHLRWTSQMGFVYCPGSEGKQINAATLVTIKQAFRKCEIQPEQQIGERIIETWDSDGRPIVVETAVSESGPSVFSGSSGPSESTTGLDERLVGSLPIRPKVANFRAAEFNRRELSDLRRDKLIHLVKAFSRVVDVEPWSSAPSADAQKGDLVEYIFQAQDHLPFDLDAAALWTDMHLQRDDIQVLRAQTLRIACRSLGDESNTSNKSKKQLVEKVVELLDLE